MSHFCSLHPRSCALPAVAVPALYLGFFPDWGRTSPLLRSRSVPHMPPAGARRGFFGDVAKVALSAWVRSSASCVGPAASIPGGNGCGAWSAGPWWGPCSFGVGIVGGGRGAVEVLGLVWWSAPIRVGGRLIVISVLVGRCGRCGWARWGV